MIHFDKRLGATDNGQRTNVRRFDVRAYALLAELRALLKAQTANAFAIGDLVNQLGKAHQMRVKDIARILGASRQRLSEFRRTARAFPAGRRSFKVDFHFYTIASRAARRLGMLPQEVLKDVIDHRLGSTRKATAYLAAKMRAKESTLAGPQSALLLAKGAKVLDACHHADYRNVILKLPDRSIKVIVADPPYGQYGQYLDGEHTTVASTHRECDGLHDERAREVTIDLFRLALPKLAPGGCMIVFRPGGIADASWLLAAAEQHGWGCRHALVWHKGSVKLGRVQEPYSVSSERLLVFAREKDQLINHDGSERSDIIRFAPVRPTYVTGQDHHLFEKPVELARFLVRKHTHPGELVFEPFGATGPVAVAAIELGRHWVYCETNATNFQMGSNRIAEAMRRLADKAG